MLSEEFKICKDTAEEFMYVAQEYSKDVNTFFNYASVFSVNAALACELYFKAILIYNSSENKAVKEHDLSKLLDELPQTVQTYIANEYKTKLNKSLTEFLKKYGNSFIKWRYPHEQSVEIGITEILTLVDILHNYVETLS